MTKSLYRLISEWVESLFVLPTFKELPDAELSECTDSGSVASIASSAIQETSSSTHGSEDESRTKTAGNGDDEDVMELMKQLKVTLGKIRELKGRSVMSEERKEKAFLEAFGFEVVEEQSKKPLAPQDEEGPAKKVKWDDPKECLICHRWAINMRRHGCSNTNEYRCKSPGCPKTFKRLDALKRHSKRVHGLVLSGASAAHMSK